jgi:hypothetical protein
MTRNGMHPREYESWSGAKKRCTNPNTVGYKNYGGRGISMCERWFNSFENFFADMGICPDNFSIERVNNDGNYEPSNCIWADRKTQANNTRRSLKNR